MTAGALAATVAGERGASACGGCFHPPTQTVTDITDERMLLAVSGTQSTLYDQIQYSGSPSNFAWVLPIHGTVTVGLSADVLFDSIDELTATQINPPPQNCPPPPNCNQKNGSGFAAVAGPSAADAGAVTILAAMNVGPYETVQLKSTDGTALQTWLTTNGYNVPASVQPILSAYVQAGFDFLAMKLLPDQGVQSMRPVRVSTPGASLTLPLRMASVGTGAITGITVWIVADGRYEPQNFPFFHIDDSQLVWDFAANLSNYTTLRVAQEAKSNNSAWEIESSLALNESIIQNVIQSGGQYYGNGSVISQPADPAIDYLPVGTPDAGGDAGSYQTAEEVRETDVNALFVGMAGPTVRVTRIRTDIAQTAMTQDIVFQASSDQSELSNIRQVTQSVNLTCPVYNGCQYIGTASPDGGNFVPANTSGSGVGGSGATGSGATGTGTTGTGTNGATSSNAGSNSGGCTTSAGGAGSGVGFAALAGVLALFVQRTARRRKSKS
ncbi:MAG TPA: DUF2330 domain-containing protein [Polyangiaceae bacterium]|nr:DUF2330 domain-containing protein [Polyangiaceae bacterium]